MLTPSVPGLEIMFSSVQGFNMLGQAVEPSLLPHPTSSWSFVCIQEFGRGTGTTWYLGYHAKK